MKIIYNILFSKKLILAIFSILFVIIFISKTNIYWGWVDDIFYQNNFNSLYSTKPIYDPDYFVGLSNLLIFLYKIYPDVGWLGYFLFFLLSTSYLIFLLLVFNSQIISKNNLLLYAIIIILSCFVQYSFFRLNFTVVATLGLFAGYFLIAFTQKSVIKFFGIVVFTISLLIRPNILGVITLQLIIITAYNYIIGGKEKNKLKNIIYLTFPLLILIILRISLHNADSINFDTNGRLEWLFQDGYLLNISPEIQEDKTLLLIYEAIISWNTQDNEILHKNTYIEFINLLSNKINLWNVFLKKLSLSIDFPRRYHGELESFNFHFKYLLLITTFLAISIITLFKTYKSEKFHYFASVIFSTLGLITILFILAKVEERFTLTYIWSVTLLIFLLCNKHKVKIGFQGLIFFLISVVIGFQYITQTIAQSHILEKNLILSKNTVKYINKNFKGKTVLLDTYTPYLFNESPFNTVRIDSRIHLSMSLNYTRNYFHSIQNYWNNYCENTNTYIETFKCILTNKDRVLFFYRDYNVNFLGRWNSHFYNEKYQFTIINDQHLPKDNLYMWDRHRYHFYQLETE